MTLLADALRNTLQDMDQAIQHARTCIRTDSPRKAEFLSEYLRLVRYAHELKDERQAEVNIVLAICQPHLPMPFNPGFVGLSEEERFSKEWDMSFRAVPPATAAPVVAQKRAA